MTFHTDIVQISPTSENVLTISLERKARESSTSQSVHLRVEVCSSSNEVRYYFIRGGIALYIKILEERKGPELFNPYILKQYQEESMAITVFIF